MGAADTGGAGPDLYRLLGVSRSASRDEALTRGQIPVPGSRPLEPSVVTPRVRRPGSPALWAGPVRVEVPLEDRDWPW
jgi:hypothetical protein